MLAGALPEHGRRLPPLLAPLRRSITMSAHNAPLFREEKEKLCGQEESMDG
jgi:hypothetical protein